MVKKYYEILEINETATQEEIKKAYRKLALRWHPDKNPHNQEEAKKKFQEINQAYGVLSNEEFKKKYDAGETNFSAGFDNGYAKSYWEAKEEKLAEEIKIMEDLLKAHKERQEAWEKIWLLNAEYLERWDTHSDIGRAFDATWPVVIEEYLDKKYHKLWEPYQSWSEMIWTIPLNLKYKEKEHSEELKTLKEGMIKAIKEAEAKRKAEEVEEERKSEERADSKIEKEKRLAVEEVERLMTRKGLKAEDLGEHSDYKKKINELDKVWKIRDLRDKITTFIRRQKGKVNDNNDRKGESERGDNQPVNQNNQDGKETKGGQIPDNSNDNNQKINYGNLTKDELINTINQKDLEIGSLQEIITALEKKIAELEEEIQELKSEKQTPQIQQEIEKRETQLQEAKNSLAKINSLSSEKPAGDTGNKSDNKFPAGWVVGGGVLVVVGLMAILVIKKKSRKKLV